MHDLSLKKKRETILFLSFHSIYLEEQLVVDSYRSSIFRWGGDPAAGSPTATLLRLHPSHRPHRGKRPPAVRLPTSGATNSHGVTGGVYKAGNVFTAAF